MVVFIICGLVINLFIYLFLLINIFFFINFNLIWKAVFASAIPEIAQIIGNRPKYAGSYKMEKGKR